MQEAQAPKFDRFSNTAAALANLCISVHYGKLNLMLPSALKSQKITFIFMKCTKTVATRAGPFGPDMHQIICRLGLRPRPQLGELIALPQTPSWFRGGTPGGRGRWRGGKGRGREWREGSGMRGGKGMGRKGRGGKGNKHTRFKTCGAAHANPNPIFNQNTQ